MSYESSKGSCTHEEPEEGHVAISYFLSGLTSWWIRVTSRHSADCAGLGVRNSGFKSGFLLSKHMTLGKLLNFCDSASFSIK